MYKCKYCGKEFETASALAGHVSHCKLNPNKTRDYSDSTKKSGETLHKKYLEANPILEFNLICPKCGKPFTVKTTQKKYDKGEYCHYCSISCRNSRVRTQETKDKISRGVKNSVKFQENNKKGVEKRIINQYYKENNLKENTTKIVKKDVSTIVKNGEKLYTCKYCGKPFTYKESHSRQYCCSECRNKYVEENVKPKLGGYRKGSGRGKSGWYKGIYCDSSWELAYVVYCLDNNIPIKRCTEPIKYMFNNEEHKYFPDFITNEGIIEIKGYKTEQWEAKLIQANNIKVLYKEDMKPYLDYVHDKYGFDYINLYDNSNPKLDLSKRKFAWLHKDDENVFVKVIFLNVSFLCFSSNLSCLNLSL